MSENTDHAAIRPAGSSSPALPPPSGIDPDWREKIETAKRVREETRQARRGKPATFDMEGPPIRVGSGRVERPFIRPSTRRAPNGKL